MTHRSLFASGVLAIALALPVAASAQHGGRIKVPAVPSNLVVPEGNVVFLHTRAFGTQNYVCLPSTTGVAWKLFGPQATLYPPKMPLQIATHFLSPNPDEEGTPRPTWQHSLDGSSVWARLHLPTSTSTDPNYVAAGAIPWLLLQVVGADDGPIGGGLLARATFIHRLNTAGGAAPATGCDATQIGATAFVSYSTDYFFYRAEKK